jgi:hypothetical protein
MLVLSLHHILSCGNLGNRLRSIRLVQIGAMISKEMKPANPPIDVPGCTPFQQRDNLSRAVVAVPKAEIDRREKEWKRAKMGKKAPRL